MAYNPFAGLREAYPEKCAEEGVIFSHIHPGDHIFIGTGCGEPQRLVGSLTRFVQTHPKAFVDAEVLQVWSLGVAPYTDEKYLDNFRQNSFFIGKNTREAVNRGGADYTPVFLSTVPGLLKSGRVRVDVALIQTSMPDSHGYVSLGISVDIVKAAVENSKLVVAQVNPAMPRVHGDTFIHVSDIDYFLPFEEALLEFETFVPDEIVQKIGRYVAQVIQDGDTIQVGYGSIPNAILSHLSGKRHLGVHTELLTDGIVELIRQGVVDNTFKALNRNKTV
nr:hypothetical protein [Nitrospiraceae bacterium]